MKLTNTTIWKQLEEHALAMSSFHLRDEFDKDDKRFEKYSINLNNLLFDYSKQRINEDTISLLLQLAEYSNLEKWQDKLFKGDKINHTENRAVLHTALRSFSEATIIVDKQNVKGDVEVVLKKMETFIERIHSGEWKGYTGKPIDTIVNIGIGGSDLGPKMLYKALKPYHDPKIHVHFISNLDGADLADCIAHINPETTLFTIASKTFTTLETLQNAHTARAWFLRHSGDESTIAKHFVAISTNKESVSKFGIDTENMFEFWDWVGGRFSLWSAIGLPLALGIGMEHFNSLREGAFSADIHFKATPFEENIPVLMALIGIWNRNFLNAETLAVLPYDHALSKLPDFLQQLEMESNGKSVDRDGNFIHYETNPVLWGATGNNGQHAFFQLLHQSNTLVPIDFIGVVNSSYSLKGHQQRLFSNMTAQAEALMRGKNEDEALKELKTEEKHLASYKVFKGNVPSSTLLFKHITPHSLGMLIAFYEHKVFVQGVIWNLNSYDQWGVELGKKLANDVLNDLVNNDKSNKHDSSTEGLMSYFKSNFMDDIAL